MLDEAGPHDPRESTIGDNVEGANVNRVAGMIAGLLLTAHRGGDVNARRLVSIEKVRLLIMSRCDPNTSRQLRPRLVRKARVARQEVATLGFEVGATSDLEEGAINSLQKGTIDDRDTKVRTMT